MIAIPIPKPGRMLRFEFDVENEDDIAKLKGIITLKFGDVDVYVQCLEVTDLGDNKVEIFGEVVERLN